MPHGWGGYYYFFYDMPATEIPPLEEVAEFYNYTFVQQGTEANVNCQAQQHSDLALSHNTDRILSFPWDGDAVAYEWTGHFGPNK